MESERYAVVFDTNSYRNLILHKPIEEVKEFIGQLRKKENIKEYCCVWNPCGRHGNAGKPGRTGKELAL